MESKVVCVLHNNPSVRDESGRVLRYLQSAIGNLKSNIHRGHSSVGRAPALQAGSQGFESPCLQSFEEAWRQNPTEGGTLLDALAGA